SKPKIVCDCKHCSHPECLAVFTQVLVLSLLNKPLTRGILFQTREHRNVIDLSRRTAVSQVERPFQSCEITIYRPVLCPSSLPLLNVAIDLVGGDIHGSQLPKERQQVVPPSLLGQC